MGGSRWGPAGAAAALAAVGAVVAGACSPAYADSTVVVQGTAFPDPVRATLSFVGCDAIYDRTAEELRPMVGYGPGTAPRGQRSLGWDLAGGNAVGVLYSVPSVLSTFTASLSVNAQGPATGVAYAGYQEPADSGSSLLWVGRADLATPGGAWHDVEATTRSYAWTKYDMQTGQPVADGPAGRSTPADFAQAHGGDGPGVYTIGFGCDGTPFSMDAPRVGALGDVTTYDIEGLQTDVSISSSPTDGAVTVTGTLRTGTGDPIPHATMILEQRTAGSSEWTQAQVVSVGPDGVARATVDPEERTFYRWRFVDRPLADGSLSMALPVDPQPAGPNDPSDPGDPTATPTPTTSPTTAPTESPSSDPSPTWDASPSDQPSPTDDTGSPSPSSSPSDSSSAPAATESSPSDSPSETPSRPTAPEPSPTG